MAIETAGTKFNLSLEHFSGARFGGDSSRRFEPFAHFLKWDTHFGFGLETTAKPLVQFDGDKIQWFDSVNNIGLTYYTKPQDEFGAVEIEIVLGRKPSRNAIEMPIETEGLVFHKQPYRLSARLKAMGSQPIRPEVKNSYAVFHKSKSQGKIYRTGKAFHLYRFTATDAKNRRIWLNATIDIERKRLVIPLPDWFAAATYPVIIGPTLGYTTIGQTITDFSAYCIGNHTIQIPTNGTATDYNIALSTSLGSPQNMAFAIYNSTGTTSNSQSMVSSTASTSMTATNAFVSISISGSLVSGSYYYLPFISQGTIGTYYDVTGAARSYELESFYPTFPSSFGASDLTNDNGSTSSVYIDYTTGGGGGGDNQEWTSRSSTLVHSYNNVGY